jgi:hypothetical protein
MGQESLNFGRRHLPWMPQLMKANEAPHPKDVCLLGTQTVMDPLANLFEQPTEFP